MKMGIMIRVCIGGAIVCGLIVILSTVMIFVRLEQWFEFLLTAGVGCIGVVVMILGASAILQEKGGPK